MNRYAPPRTAVEDLGPPQTGSGFQWLRNLASLVLGAPVGWLAVMGSRFLVRITHSWFLPHLTRRYSIGVAEFLTALPFAVAAGALAYFAFAGTRRQVWWWSLSLFLACLALAAVEPLVPDESFRSVVIMSFLEFSPFLFIGLTATILHRRTLKGGAETAAKPPMNG